MMGSMEPLVVSALVLVRDRRLLMVTARGRDVLYLPGGKREAGETGEDALARETREEVGLELDPRACTS
jgi:8-oxo-dGTP diphosphatase